jgi:membrane-associated phospholipid phosphatase
VVAGAAGGFALGAAWGSATAGRADSPALRGARGADAAVLGLGLGVWLGPKLLDLGAAELGHGRFSDCRGGRDALPGIDRWFRERLAGHSSLGGRRAAARWADLTLAAALAQPFGLATGADPPRLERDLLVGAGTLGVTIAVAGAVKKVFDRPRPYAHYCEPLWPGALRTRDAHYSFPSGHVSLTFAAAFLSARLAEMHDLPSRGRVWATGLTLASATALLQMRADKHYFTDVAVGAGVGALMGWFLPALHRPSASATTSVRPAAAPVALSLALPPPRGSGVVLLQARYARGGSINIAWMW